MADDNKTQTRVVARGRGNVTVTPVSAETEVWTPFKVWVLLMGLLPFLAMLGWSVIFLLWLYDAYQGNQDFLYWRLYKVSPWWEKGNWIWIVLSIVAAWAVATGIAIYRFWTELWFKEWDARDGLAVPGKVVPPEQRMG